MKRPTLASVALIIFGPPTHAEEALIAVAANFSGVAQQLEVVFESTTSHDVTITSGSTGNLYAQILNGAPYDVLLAADQERPKLLELSGDAVAGSRFTFASGRLALWSADSALIRADIKGTLRQKEITALAIANPALAPYGVASREALQSLQIWDSVRDRIVMGQNVGQAYALIATGNAQAGIVALSLVIGHGEIAGRNYLAVPRHLHAPIDQDAVLLRHGQANSAAIEFMAFLKSAQGRETIRSNGYGVN
jgi:molybdenum ABC transporter molybdate-binding protein